MRGDGTSPLFLVTGDSGASRPAGTLLGEVDKALYFAADAEVVGVVGPGGSREALQTAPIYQHAGLPNLLPTATSSLLHHAGRWTFMMAPDDSVQGEFIGAFVADRLSARSVLLFYIPDEYGLGLATGTQAALARRGVRLLDRVAIRTRERCPPETPENPYTSAVAAALNTERPDVIVIAGRTNETACIARAVSGRLAGARIVAGDGVLVNDAFERMAGAAADSIYLVAFWHPSNEAAASRGFVTRFQALVGRVPQHDDAMYYDAVMLMAAAMGSAGADRTAIRDYLETLGRSRPPYQGITGPIAFTPEARRPLLMTRIRDHRTEPVPAR
ncbi:MAG TPA: ABC transporter substrate-binding protein [Gemmatimonadales bacterium]|nr:ABC transporter substrate-binding protein [Gemmatimonadales bacterium]